MGRLKFEVPHRLPKDEAKARIEQLVTKWASKYGINVNWAGDSATLQGVVKGIKLDANLNIADGKVGGDANDPGILLRGVAQKYLTEKLNYYLDPARTPDSDGSDD